MSKRNYTEEVNQFIINNHDKYTFEEMAEQINTRFGYNKTPRNIETHMRQLRLKPKITPNPLNYTKEMDDFIIKNCKGIRKSELVELFNKEFGTDRSIWSIKKRMTRIGARNELLLHKDTHPAINNPNSIKTRFKKGDKCRFAKPVGSERVKVDGYIEVKINQDTWEKKHRVVYENAFGSLKQGEIILFLDGNKNNLDISNLAKVTNRELLKANMNNLLFDNKELTKTGLNIAKLMIACEERRK